MANFNFDFEKYYRPILEQSTAVGDATNQLTGFQQGQGTAMMDLQKMMQEVSAGYKKANDARAAAVTKVAGGSGQYAQALPATINPMARQALAQARYGQDVGELAGANNTLQMLQESDMDRLGKAMQFRNAEEARLAGAVQAQKDRYVMMQQEFDKAYQMEADRWNRDFQQEESARQAAASGASQALAREQFNWQKEQAEKQAPLVATAQALEALKADADAYAKNKATVNDGIQDVFDPSLYEYNFQDYIYQQLGQEQSPYVADPSVNRDVLWSYWRALPSVTYDNQAQAPAASPNLSVLNSEGSSLGSGFSRSPLQQASSGANEQQISMPNDYMSLFNRDYGIQ